jgi:hypothetical protein
MPARSWTDWVASLRGTFIPLLVGLLVTLVAGPLVSDWPLASAILVSLVLITGVFAVHQGIWLRGGMVLGLLVVLVLRWLAQIYGDHRILLVVGHGAVGGYLLLLTGLCVAVVLQRRQITRDTVMGAICGYLLIAYVFGFVYAVLTDVDAASFRSTTGPTPAGDPARIGQGTDQLLYFSFVTLTTVGYGDIVPASKLARSLAMLEMLAGPLYLAAYVARLVAGLGTEVRRDGADLDKR